MVVDLDTFIKEVYDLLGHSWKFLARELGFSKTDIDALEHDNPYLMKEQIYQMFDQWKRREGNGATSDKLLAAMKSAGGFDEQVKILTGKGMIEYEKSKSNIVMLRLYRICTCTIFTISYYDVLLDTCIR